MGKRLYVGNLAYSVKSQDLQEIFQLIGDVLSAKVVTDMQTNRSKGFGFVEMASEDLAKKAIEDINGKEVGGRALRVGQATPRPSQGRI